MIAHIVVISVQELMDRINKERADAYTSGYVQGRKEAEKAAALRQDQHFTPPVSKPKVKKK